MPRYLSLLRLDHFKYFCLKLIFWFDGLNSVSLGWVLGFGQNNASCFTSELRSAAYPEGAVGDADSVPGDGQGVFEGGSRRVGASVEPVTFTLHLHLHRKSLCVLTEQQMRRQSETRWNALVTTCGYIFASYLTHDLQRSFPSILSADCELSRLVDQAASFLKPWPVGLNLQTRRKASTQH